MRRVWIEYIAGAIILATIIIGAVHSFNTPPWTDERELPLQR